MGGYVKLWRSSVENGWLKSGRQPLWHFWTWCLLEASFKQRDVLVGRKKIPLDPGQFITTYAKSAKENGITLRQARDCIAALKMADNVSVKTTNKFSIITIINWARYQGEDCEDGRQNGRQMADNMAVKRQTKNPSVRQVLVEEGKECKRESIVGAGAHAFKEAIEIPSWIPIQIWKDWKEFRIRKKAPLTERAVKKTIEELGRLRDAGNDPEAVLEQSIYRGWTGVFALKSDFKKMSQQTRAEKVNASMAVFARREDERQKERERLDREEGRDRPDPNDDVCLLPD